MTEKDYMKIADVLGNKLQEVKNWKNPEAISLMLAVTEDFMEMLKSDNPRFDEDKFTSYINKNFQV